MSNQDTDRAILADMEPLLQWLVTFGPPGPKELARELWNRKEALEQCRE